MKSPEEYHKEFTSNLKSGFRQMIYNMDKKILIKRIVTIQTEAYNQAIEDATENAKSGYVRVGKSDDIMHVVDKQSILKLKK